MTTAAESPGTEVQQGKGGRWKNWYSLIPTLFFPCCAAISLLVGMGVFALIGVLEDINGGYAKADIKLLEISVWRYKPMMNKYPESLNDLATRPDDANAFLKAQVQKSALKDPWGEPYQYRNPGLKNPDSFDLFSKGQDKTEGTEDDIGNW